MQAIEGTGRTFRHRAVRSVVLGVAIVALGGLYFLPCQGNDPTRQAFVAAVTAPSALPPVPVPLTLDPITPELRRKGYHVCNPHDPIGLGPYRPYAPLTTGRALIPQVGGYTPDHGFDVLVHFHGHRAARIALVQVSRGTTFVGSDFGLGSHAYAKAFATWRRFPHMLRSLTNALKKASGHEDAHIRHLTLSAWSAGYGAVNEILKLHGDDHVDAVVLLDGLHASWNPQARRRGGIDAVMMRRIEPIVSFARKAQRGEKLFVLTHSEIETESYVSTKLSADRLLRDLGMERRPVSPGDNAYGQTGVVNVEGFYLWSYKGKGEMAHCSHLRHLATIVRDVIEPAFDTPAMNRDVPPTKAPLLGVPAAAEVADAGALDGSSDEGDGGLALGDGEAGPGAVVDADGGAMEPFEPEGGSEPEPTPDEVIARTGDAGSST